MKKSTWIWIITIFLCTLLILISYLVVKASQQKIIVEWKRYNNTGINADAIKVFIWEIKKDSIWVRDIKLGETSIQDTIFNFTYQEKPIVNKYYSISVVDSSGNESILDGVDSLDFQAPGMQDIFKGVKKTD